MKIITTTDKLVWLLGQLVIWPTLMMMTPSVNGRPQDPSNMFESMGANALSMMGNAAEMLGNAGLVSKKIDFDLSFAKVKSETELGTGAAMRQDYDSSEEDRRRKRAVNFTLKKNAITKENSPFLPHNHIYLHRQKRASCRGGGGTGDADADGEDIDVAERRRRRANARKRKAAAQRKKAQSGKKTKSKITNEQFVNDAINRALIRRKRQTEVDDLTTNINNASQNISQKAQQVAEKVRSIWEGFMTSMTEMTERFKQHLTQSTSTNTEEI